MIDMNDRELLLRIADKASYISSVSAELYINMEIGPDEQKWLSDVYLDLQDIAEQLDAYRKVE
jgi:hypothetical protein